MQTVLVDCSKLYWGVLGSSVMQTVLVDCSNLYWGVLG